MSAYSIVNLKKEVEDSMGERAPGIEGRFARKHLDSKHLGISYLRYSPGVRSPSAHSHREQEEAYVVISGSGQVRLDDEIRELRCWDVVRVNRNGAGVRSRRRRPRTDRHRLRSPRRRRRRLRRPSLDRLSSGVRFREARNVFTRLAEHGHPGTDAPTIRFP